MKRRIIAAVVAVALAAVGAVGLYSYVHRADQRAMAGLQTSNVLMVTKLIPEGTTPDQLSKSVTSKLLPDTAVVPGAVSSLDELNGLAATADLQPGEQVIKSRFADPNSLADAQSAPVPKGMEEISLQLDSQRVLGGNLVPGETVGVFFTVGKDDAKRTHLGLHRVLVSRVQGGLGPAPASGQASDKPAPMPDGGSVMVTLAVSAADAEKIVFAAENGSIWLSHQPADATQSGTRIVTEGSVLQ
jgi:pilus assembly protein CpaB